MEDVASFPGRQPFLLTRLWQDLDVGEGPHVSGNIGNRNVLTRLSKPEVENCFNVTQRDTRDDSNGAGHANSR